MRNQVKDYSCPYFCRIGDSLEHCLNVIELFKKVLIACTTATTKVKKLKVILQPPWSLLATKIQSESVQSLQE